MRSVSGRRPAGGSALTVTRSPAFLAALDFAAEAIRNADGGDQHSETGWKSNEALNHWLAIRAFADELAEIAAWDAAVGDRESDATGTAGA